MTTPLLFATADAAASADLGAATCFQTLGRFHPGDGGGGVYERADKARSGADLTVADGGVFALRTAAPTLRHFGARGDGATDDSAAVQAAFDCALYGETLTAPAGRYRVVALNLKRTVTLIGDGATFVCDDPNEERDLMRVIRGRVDIHRLRFEGAQYETEHSPVGPNALLRVSDKTPEVAGLRVVDCDFVGAKHGLMIGQAEDVFLERVRCERQKETGLILHRGPRRVVIRGFTARDVGLYGGVRTGFRHIERPIESVLISEFLIENCGRLAEDPSNWQAGLDLTCGFARHVQAANGQIIDCGAGVEMKTGAPEVPTRGETLEDIVLSNLTIRCDGDVSGMKLGWVGAPTDADKAAQRLLITGCVIRHRGAERRVGNAFMIGPWEQVEIRDTLVDGAVVGVRFRPVGGRDGCARGIVVSGCTFRAVDIGLEATTDGAIEDLRIVHNQIYARRGAIDFAGAPVRRVQIDHNQLAQTDKLGDLERFAAVRLTNVSEALVLSNRIDSLGGMAIDAPALAADSTAQPVGGGPGGAIAFNVVTAAFVPFQFGAGRWRLSMNDVRGATDGASFVADEGAEVDAVFTLRGARDAAPESAGARGDLWISSAVAQADAFGWLSPYDHAEWRAITATPPEGDAT